MDKKTIDLYMGEHTEDPGKTSEDDLSEVIPIKEPDVDGYSLPFLKWSMGFRCAFKCFFVLSCFGVNSLQVCLEKQVGEVCHCGS